MTTFKVEDVEMSSKQLSRGNEEQIILERCGSVKPEARSQLKYVPFESSGSYKPLNNAFVAAVHTAFANHYPLVLSPDQLWLVIAQGFAFHVNANAEKLRKKFVNHEGKKTIEIWRDDFVKGSPKNPWGEALDDFSEGIRRNVGDKTYDLLTPVFSTTGPIERAAANIVLMNTFKDYFACSLVGICGIPEVTLKGTPEDWNLLREKALFLGQFDLEWWMDELKPILDQFVDAASGKVDLEFWRRIYKLHEAYAVQRINGWVVNLFPYIEDGTKKNPCLGQWMTIPLNKKRKVSKSKYSSIDIDEDGLESDLFPPGIASTPFVLKFLLGKEYNMVLFAGFMAATQDPETLAIHPEIGWGVADEKAEKNAAKWQEERDWRFRYKHSVSIVHSVETD
jgi:hypothetical protein